MCAYARALCRAWSAGDYVGDMGGFAWAVGAGGAIYGYDMTSWVQYPSPTTAALLDVAVIREDFAVAVGEGGVIVEWYGHMPPNQWTVSPSYAGWALVASPTSHTLRSVGMGSTGAVFAVGDAGVRCRARVCVCVCTPPPL